MKLTLSHIKEYKQLSDETLAFSCVLLLDGKKVGTAENTGKGGSNQYYWLDAEAGRALHTWARAQVTDFSFEHLDILISRMLDETLFQKKLKTWCKTKTLFQLQGDDSDSFRTLKTPYSPQVDAYLVSKFGAQLVRIVNKELNDAAA